MRLPAVQSLSTLSVVHLAEWETTKQETGETKIRKEQVR